MHAPCPPPARRLRDLLAGDAFLTMPCCFDGLSARLIERAGFQLTFMSGFAVAGARFGLPDTGLIGGAEMAQAGREICAATDLPVIGDGDTGHGNAINVRRTVAEFARAGFAGVMIEDQVSPKRCGHTPGKQVVDRGEAETRIRAAVDAREALRDQGGDIVLMARTDARGTHGIDEALARMDRFAELGADILFLEAPRSEDEMRTFCDRVPGVKMANMIDNGLTPVLAPAALHEMGYKIAAYPLTLLQAVTRAMEDALEALAAGRPPERLAHFDHVKEVVGFPEYWGLEKDYGSEAGND